MEKTKNCFCDFLRAYLYSPKFSEANKELFLSPLLRALRSVAEGERSRESSFFFVNYTCQLDHVQKPSIIVGTFLDVTGIQKRKAMIMRGPLWRIEFSSLFFLPSSYVAPSFF